MKDYFMVFIFLLSGFMGFSQCIITNQPLSSQVVCQNGSTTPLEVINEPPSQCTSVCSGQGVTTFQWFVNNTSDTLGSQIISGADSNVYIPPSNIIGQDYFFCRIYVDGCLWNFSDIVSVVIVGLPNPNLSDGVMCSGQQPYWGAYSDQIIFEPMSDTLGTFSYGWIVPTSMGDPGDVNQIFCDFEGLYVVSVIDMNGCVGVDSAFITVLPASISDVSITNNSGNIFYCEGDTINLTAAIYNGFGFTNVADGTTVVWTTPFNQPNPGNVVSFNTTIPGNYEVQVLDLNGCWSSTYIPQDVSFSPMPTLSLNSVSICQGNSVTLTALTSISGGDFSWDDGSTYYGSSASISVSPIETTTYLVYYTTIDGCEASTSGTVTITPITSGMDNITSCSPITWIDGNVYTSNNNTATFNIVGGSTAGCDSLVTLNLTILPAVSGTDNITSCTPITWIDGNVYTSNNNTSTFNIVGGATNGCDSLVTLNLTINPSATLSVNSQTICSGESTTLTVVPSILGGTYLWSPGSETTETITVSPSSTTTYTVTYTLGDCQSSEIATVIVNLNPVVSAGSDVNMCHGDSVMLSATGAQSYNWNNGIGVGNDIFVSPSSLTSYSVTGTDSLGCSAMDTVIVNPAQFIPPTVATFPAEPGLCNGTGSVTLDPNGNFSIYWSNGVEGENGYDLCPGLTVVYVIENNYGCQYSAYGFVEETGNSYPLSIQLSVQDVSFDGNCDGLAQFFGYGGVPPYTYELVDVANSLVGAQEWVDMLCSGYYNIRIMDAIGDIDSLPFYVADPSNIFSFNPFLDSIIIDTLHTEIYEDCNIDFETVDSAWVTQINYINADTAIITWAIQDMNGIQYIDQSYNVTNLQGSFTVELTVFCPGKALGDPYLKVYTTIYISNDFNVSINELSETDVISLYPNPTSDYVQIKSQNKIDRIQLFDSFGREIALSNKISENEYKIRLPKENGMYLVKIVCENGKSYSRRIVKTSKY